MNISTIQLLLTLCLTLLSNPKLTPDQKAFVNHAAQIAQMALAEAEAPNVAATPAPQIETPNAPAYMLQFGGASYPDTKANEFIIDQLHQKQNDCSIREYAVKGKLNDPVQADNRPFLTAQLDQIETECENEISDLRSELTH